MRLHSAGIISLTAIVCAGFSSCGALRQRDGGQGVSTLIIHYGCPTCHVIPHVPGAVGKVGPSLENLAQRSYLAGTLQNSPDDLVRWIQHPQQLHPGTAMPEMGVTAEDARQIAAFLEEQK